MGEHVERLEIQVEENLVIRGDRRGSADDPAVILLHGGGQTRFSWKDTADILSSSGWNAITLDARGHGESDWAPDGVYGPEKGAQDLIAAVAELGLDKPVFVGASMGGMTAVNACHRFDGQLASGVVLVDIAPRFEPAGSKRIIDFMRARPDGFETLEEVADAIAAYNPNRRRPSSLEGLRKNLRLRNGRFHWHFDPKMVPDQSHIEKRSFDFAEAARSLDVPTLLVRGKMSDLLSEEGAQDFLKLVPHAQYANVAGAGHMVAGDENDLFTRSVVGFLNRDVRPSLF